MRYLSLLLLTALVVGCPAHRPSDPALPAEHWNDTVWRVSTIQTLAHNKRTTGDWNFDWPPGTPESAVEVLKDEARAVINNWHGK